MKKYMWMLAFMAAIFFLSQNSITYAQESDKHRVIYVLYDNSSSMTFDEESKSEFYTYWVEADYAMRALAASRKSDDSIYIYPMNSEQGDAIEVNKTDDVDKASRCFYGDTPFDSIEKAAQALGAATNPGDEKWLLIFTDGMFLNSRKKSVSKDELKRQLNSVRPDIHVLYLPIGREYPEGKVIKFSSGELNDNIAQISGNESMLQLILDGCNTIYGRNVLEPEKNTDARYKIDVPIKELIVFLQEEGEEYLFNDEIGDEGDGSEVQKNCINKLEDFEKSIVPALGISRERAESFQSYHGDAPDYKGSEMALSQFHNNLKTKDIYGVMARFESNGTDKPGSYDFEYEFQLVQGKETAALYYNLDLGVEVEITQNGSRLYNWKVPSGGFRSGESDEAGKKGALAQGESDNEPDKLLLTEGDYEITVYPTTSDGEMRIKSDAELLQKVSLKLNGETCEFGKTVTARAEYGQPVSLEVLASGGGLSEMLSLNREFDVSRQLYPLSLEVKELPEYFDYGEMEAGEGRITESGSCFSVVVKEDTQEGKVAVRNDLLNQIGLHGTIRYKNMKKTPGIGVQITEGEEKGEYRVYPYLENADDDSTYEDVVCDLTVFYEALPEDSSEHLSEDWLEKLAGKLEVKLLLKAEPQELQVTINSAPEYTFWKFLKDGVGLKITCNGSQIPDDAEIDVKSLNGDEKYKLSCRKWIKGGGRALGFFFYGKNEIPVHKEITYLRRGAPCVGSVNDVLTFRPVPLGVRIIAFLLFITVVLILAFAIIAWFADFGFGINFCPLIILKVPDGGSDIRKLERKTLHEVFGFGRKVKISNKDNFLSREDFPDMCLKKTGRTSFCVINYEDFQRKDITVNGVRITQYTQVDYDDIMQVTDYKGVRYTICFTKKIGREV